MVGYAANLICIWGAVIAGFGSAALWYIASTVVVKKGDARAAGNIFLGGVAIQAAAREQARYNKWAALSTGTAVLLQTLSSFFNHW